MLTSVTRKLELRAELGLEAHVLEREPDRRRDELDRVGLVGERRVVDERRHAPAVPVDERHLARGCRLGLGDVAAVGVDPRIAVSEPVDDLERRIVQRVGDRVAERDACVEWSTSIRAADERSKRVRRTPARNASGTAANAIRKRIQTSEYERLDTSSAATERDHEAERQAAGEVDGASVRRRLGLLGASAARG